MDAYSDAEHPADDLALDSEDDFVELAVEVFTVLADATRVRIVLALREGEKPVSELVDLLDRPQAAVSQHLARLRLSRIVTTRREGPRVFYRLVDEHALSLVTEAIHQAQHALGGTPAHHVAEEESAQSDA